MIGFKVYNHTTIFLLHLVFEISGSHGGEYEIQSLLVYTAV
jgi:hypothetical protein